MRLDLPAGIAASRLTLSNEGDEAVSAQVRLFKWVQEGGADKLVETRDVVASPPMLRLQPGKSNAVRVVRVSKAPLEKEESYRVLIDQIPERKQASGAAVMLQLRYSVPVFFSPKDEQQADLVWSVENANGKAVVNVTNPGNSHVQISRLQVSPPGKAPLFKAEGLIGYVLAGSTSKLQIGNQGKHLKPGQQVTIVAEGNDTPIETRAEVR